MKKFSAGIIIAILGYALQPSFGQTTNKPAFKRTKGEPLDEKESSFAGSGSNKHSLFSHGLFAAKTGFNHQHSTQHFSVSRKANRSAFQRKTYGKRGLFGRRKSNGWGGKAFRSNSREDKRLFKGPASRKRKR